MKTEILENVPCDACGSYEFECHDENVYCVPSEVVRKAPVEVDEHDVVEH